MKYLPLCFALFALPLLAQEKKEPPATLAATSTTDTTDRSILTIDPKNRASDYVQAYELLRKDKPSLKVSLKTSGGMFSNVSDISTSENGTLMFIKILSNQGSRLMIVPIEEIVELAYSP